ncbi:hypothetical protein [Legionella erythra]|uniref:Uncharacterized protein n=1 Tax=Legionella erythra TaxID=448 RepID=A0A0W0TPX2_LEGER|nr:hypothetical protein [Legionella erythra]KTC97671.1 hypothetical protein Lery_1510 [Legionella erythra]
MARSQGWSGLGRLAIAVVKTWIPRYVEGILLYAEEMPLHVIELRLRSAPCAQNPCGRIHYKMTHIAVRYGPVITLA